MAKVTPVAPRGQNEQDHRPAVAKSALLAAGGFVTAIATVLTVSGTFAVDRATTRCALIIVGVIGIIAQAASAVYVMRR